MRTIFEYLKELSKVPPTEIYTISETLLVKENLKSLVEVVEAARNNPCRHYHSQQTCDLCDALKKLDEARRK